MSATAACEAVCSLLGAFKCLGVGTLMSLLLNCEKYSIE